MLEGVLPFARVEDEEGDMTARKNVESVEIEVKLESGGVIWLWNPFD